MKIGASFRFCVLLESLLLYRFWFSRRRHGLLTILYYRQIRNESEFLGRKDNSPKHVSIRDPLIDRFFQLSLNYYLIMPLQGFYYSV